MDVHPIRGRRWFNFGEIVAGDIVFNLRKARTVGKVTASLKCIQTVRQPGLTTSSSSTKPIVLYHSNEYTVLGLDGHMMAAQEHHFPVSFALPSHGAPLPTNFDDWFLTRGEHQWSGVKWFLELKESGSVCAETAILVFPKGSCISSRPTDLQTTQKKFSFRLPPNKTRLQAPIDRLFGQERRDQCGLTMSMSSSPYIYAGQTPEINLSLCVGFDGALVLFRVVVSFCTRVIDSSSGSTITSENSTNLAEWYPYYVRLKGRVDLTDDFRAKLRNQEIWECDLATETTSVTHFVDFTVFVADNRNRSITSKYRITCPVHVAPPIDSEAVEEGLPPPYSV